MLTELHRILLGCPDAKHRLFDSSSKIKDMSFQAYIDNIKAKTGKTPSDFKKLATQKGFSEFDLGHGHAMAIYAIFKGMK